MYALLIVVHVIASIVLILVILLQAGRGGGLSEAFGMSSTQTFFGTSATKFLQRATSVCAVVFLLTCLSLAALSTQRSHSLMDRVKPIPQAPAAKEPQKTPAETKTEPVKAEEAKSKVDAPPAAAKQEIPKPE
jgi:preprotein translocase subunit SecG